MRYVKSMIYYLSIFIGLVLAAQANADFPTDTVYNKPLHVRIGNDESYIYPIDPDVVVS